MLIVIWIITAVLVFSIIILVHEFWHFKSARIFGVKVEEFWLGIPPKAKKLFTDKKGTIYTLNWLPLWGFVRLKWENINTFHVFDEHKKLHNNESLEKAIQNDDDVFDEYHEKLTTSEKKEILKKLQDNFAKDSLLTKPYWQQAIIILAGVCMNFVLAIVIFSILFMIGVKPIGINDQIKLSQDLKLIPSPETALKIWLIKQNSWAYLLPVKDSIAQKSWIQDYDLATHINNSPIVSYEELKKTIWLFANKEISLEVKRWKNGCDITKTNNCELENITLKLTPNNEGKIGSYLMPNSEINKDFEYKFWFFESIKYATQETYGQSILTLKWIGILTKKIFNPETPKERTQAIEQVSGPIGMVDFMSKSIGNGIIFILIIWALISINLWVFNLLPIPALDGWRFLFILINGTIEKLFGKKAINEQLEGFIHVWFFIFLIALSAIIAYNDVYKIINN